MDVQASGAGSDVVIGGPSLHASQSRTDVRALAWWPVLVLLAAAAVSVAAKLWVLGIGGPQVMIDDYSLLEGGFLVWFGQAPPQHAFIESWVCGVTMLARFAWLSALSGHGEVFGGQFVSHALRDYYNAPDGYYVAYRSVLLAVDLLTAGVVYRIARRALPPVPGQPAPWQPVLVTALFLLTYNAGWCLLVGRPDTLTTFFAALGIWAYLESDADASRRTFWAAAVCFGLAAGLKMHGALFTVFAAADVVRRRGLRGVGTAVALAATAFFFFLVSDGASLFDPLMYVKARWATYHDDYSPYLVWGNQFRVAFETTGWLLLPLTLAGIVRAFRPPRSEALRSVATLAIGWLFIFFMTRQLRGYWMLPSSVLLYVLAVYGLSAVRWPAVRRGLACALVIVFAAQTVAFARRTGGADLDELRRWVRANVRQDERFYIVGYSILRLPKTTHAMQVYRAAYEREMTRDREAGMGFVSRHLKNWEERAQLRLFDMLDFRNDGGYEFYSSVELPIEKFGDLVDLDRMQYIIVHDEIRLDRMPDLNRVVTRDFELVTRCRSEGGDGTGLVNRVYRRRSAPVRSE